MVKGTQSFYPFGEMRAEWGVFDTERGFTGQIFDGGTGLGFYNAHYYDSALGKFISPDSIVPNPHDPSDFNRFVYVCNSPLIYIDPSGHCKWGLPCPKLVKDTINLAVESKNTAVVATEAANEWVRHQAETVGGAVQKAARSTANSVARARGDQLGIQEISYVGTPAGNKMLVVTGKESGLNLIDRALGGDAITLPGAAVASSGMDPAFVSTHEGTHYDEWLETTKKTGNPFAWHSGYTAELIGDWAYYGSYAEAYKASSYEERAYKASGGDPSTQLTPMDWSKVLRSVVIPTSHFAEEVSGYFN